MNQLNRNVLLWVVVGIAVLSLFNFFGSSSFRAPARDLAYSEFLDQIGTGKITDVTIEGNRLEGTSQNGPFVTYAPNDPDLIRKLTDKGVKIQVKPLETSGYSILGIFLQALPILILFWFFYYMMRQVQSGGGRAMGFGRSRAKLLTEKKGRVTFQDVAGIDEAKQELEEIVDFLKDPQKFQRLGGVIPRGILLVGAPGTGKTLLARAIAGEANVPFYTISGSDFVEMFVGVGASRVRDMFEQAKKNEPCIIFIDEIDAVGRHRGAGLGGGNDEREQTLNQLLVEMDGFDVNESIILIAATNRPDVLDPALLRPGRFDRQVVVSVPDVTGREQILKVHMQKVPLASDVDAKIIARGTPGFSGADLANLVNEAALRAARGGKKIVSMDDFEASKDKVLMGSERRSMAMTEHEKEMTAYHEAGHALVTLSVPHADPLYKISIIPRGRALGVTMSLPERDKYSHTKAEILSILAIMYGGRVAEYLIYGPDQITSGAADDIRRATDLTRKMATEWGMSDALGPLRYNDNEQEVFLGHSITQTKNVSDATAEKIDQEIRAIIERSESWAKDILTDRIDDLHKLAKALLEYETLTGDEVHRVLKGEVIGRDETKAPASAPKPTVVSSVPSSGHKKGPFEGKQGSEPSPA